jgi:hypothetical protein
VKSSFSLVATTNVGQHSWRFILVKTGRCGRGPLLSSSLMRILGLS